MRFVLWTFGFLALYFILVGLRLLLGADHFVLAPLAHYGDFIGIAVAVAVFFEEFLRQHREALTQAYEKEQTARYWVFYNSQNRVRQDLNMLREIHGQMDMSYNANERIKAAAFINVLDGFTATWKNDDVLNSAIAFEFTLLSEPEKRAVMKYFEKYNALEDHVSMIRHSFKADLKQDAYSATTDDASLAQAGSLESPQSETQQRLPKEIENLQKQLRKLVRQAIDLLELMHRVDNGRDLRATIDELEKEIEDGACMSAFDPSPDAQPMNYHIPPSTLVRSPGELALRDDELDEIKRYQNRKRAVLGRKQTTPT